jgi:hypothetical protein
MRKLLLPIMATAAVSAAALFTYRAEAAVSAAPASLRATVGHTSPVERAAACARRRVCGPRGCVWRTVCRRW